jgi:cysteine synthase
MSVRDGFVGSIGNTPLIRLRGPSELTGCNVLGKAEFLNPGGSVKDRAGLYLILDAEKRGVLKPGGTIVEGTAGNTGIGLALVANALGYKTIIVMPENQSKEKMDTLRALGAELVLVPPTKFSNPGHFVHTSRRLAEETDGAVWANQFDNIANRQGHYETTGPEIWADCPEITHFVAGLGTSGTLMGVGRYLKEQNPAVKIVAVEPPAGELVQGLRSLEDGFVPPIFDPSVLDRRMIARPRESVEWVRKLLEECGVFAGISSGAAVAGAVKLAAQMDSGTIVALLPDGGWKYLSSGAWTDDLDVVAERATRINYW